jgi:hypothetical protein
MPLVKFTDDKIIKQLRWVMIGTMLFSLTNVLMGQSMIYWHHPETAIRFDGLSINNATNHSFEFFLGLGWNIYLITNIVYISGAFFLVSVLPKRVALITIFSFILGYYFAGCNWLIVRWQLGIQGSLLYTFVLAVAIVLSSFNFTISDIKTDQIIKGLRWIMVGTILLDMTNTLIGQPIDYWHHPEFVHEANLVSRFFLIKGWYAYAFFWMGLCNCLLPFLLVSVLPRKWALITIFYLILGDFNGASNWFFYEWRMGIESTVIYGIMLSFIIVWLAFFSKHKKTNPSGMEFVIPE